MEGCRKPWHGDAGELVSSFWHPHKQTTGSQNTNTQTLVGNSRLLLFLLSAPSMGCEIRDIFTIAFTSYCSVGGLVPLPHKTEQVCNSKKLKRDVCGEVGSEGV